MPAVLPSRVAPILAMGDLACTGSRLLMGCFRSPPLPLRGFAAVALRRQLWVDARMTC